MKICETAALICPEVFSSRAWKQIFFYLITFVSIYWKLFIIIIIIFMHDYITWSYLLLGIISLLYMLTWLLTKTCGLPFSISNSATKKSFQAEWWLKLKLGTFTFLQLHNLFLWPGWNDRGLIGFCLVCLFICLSVVSFDLRYNLRMKRYRDFIFSIHTPRLMFFQMTPRSMIFWPWLLPLR